MNDIIDFSQVKCKIIFELRRIAASADGAEIYASERETLAKSLGISLRELDARFEEYQCLAETELRQWFLRCWFRAYCCGTGATHRATFA